MCPAKHVSSRLLTLKCDCRSTVAFLPDIHARGMSLTSLDASIQTYVWQIWICLYIFGTIWSSAKLQEYCG